MTVKMPCDPETDSVWNWGPDVVRCHGSDAVRRHGSDCLSFPKRMLLSPD